MMYVRFPLSLRNVEDLLHERGIDICHETVRYWWNRFGPIFAKEIRKRRIHPAPNYSNWRWHLDEVFVKINGELHYLWRAVDHEGEVLECYVTKRRNRKAAMVFMKKVIKRYGNPHVIVTDMLRSYRAAMKIIGNEQTQEVGRYKNNRCENSHLPFRKKDALARLRKQRFQGQRSMLKYRLEKTVQKFVSVHSSIHNHFNKERHLNPRHIFKVQRNAVISEWRQLSAT